MWDPTIGPTEGGAAIAILVYLGKQIKDRMNGGTTRDRLIRIETSQEHFRDELHEVKHRIERVEERIRG
jgi:hypothetical protein